MRPSLRPLLALAALLVACTPPSGEDTQDSQPVDTGEMAPFEELFTFAVLADPHLSGSADHEARAEAAVAWINEQAEARGIELVIIVGDIAWNSGTKTAPALLGQLAVPWVPITGDNEIQSEDQQAFFEAFEPQWQALEGQLEGFSHAAMPVDNPEQGVQSWFTNHSFQHRGVTFVGLDWCARITGSLFGEMADLHRFEEGTWRFVETALSEWIGHEGGAVDSVVLYSHHPMHLSPGAFDLEEMEALEGQLERWGPEIYGNFAGHYHADGEDTLDSELWTTYVTDATWDDDNRVRLVTVSGNGHRFGYEHELITVE
jgi:hypothetical protein